MIKKLPFAVTVCVAALMLSTPAVHAQSVDAQGKAELSLKSYKDQMTARAMARKAAEQDAVRKALRLKLNIDPSHPKFEAAVPDLVTSLADHLKTTFTTEGDLLTARTALAVSSAELTDLARSLGLQNLNAMEAASIIFLVDEYWGIATKLDPTKPLVSEVEYFHDKTATSDTSSRAAGSAYSDTSAKSSSSASYNGAMAASSKESAALSASQRAAVNSSSSASFAGSDRRAVAVQDGYGASAAGSRSTQVSGAQKEAFSGSSASAVSGSSSSDNRMTASVQSASAQASDQKNVRAQSFSGAQNNVQVQRDVVSVRTKTVFPDVQNAKPSDSQSALIAQKLAEVTGQYGLRYTPERDLRETGKGRMLIADIEERRLFSQYTERVAKNPYNAKYVVYGTSVMSAEGKSPSGRTLCSGMLKLESFNVDSNRGLIAGTLNKRAEGSTDQDCRSNLSTALATELAEKVGNAATRELQLAASVGQSYNVTLFSLTNISRSVGSSFEKALRQLAGGELREDGRAESTRTYNVTLKGNDLAKRMDDLLDGMGEGMKTAEVKIKGNRLVVCLEGKCPAEF